MGEWQWEGEGRSISVARARLLGNGLALELEGFMKGNKRVGMGAVGRHAGMKVSHKMVPVRHRHAWNGQEDGHRLGTVCHGHVKDTVCNGPA